MLPIGVCWCSSSLSKENTTCGKQLDRGVTLVGADPAARTSGPSRTLGAVLGHKTWGEKGYIHLVHGKGECGLADSASQPTGVKSELLRRT